MIQRLFATLGFLAFFSNSLSADVIDNIEFEFPTFQNWDITNHIENSCGSSLIYSPQRNAYDYDTETFCAQFFHTPYINTQLENFEEWFQIAFPFAELRFNVLTSDNDSVLMELYGMEDGDLEFYVLMRKICSKNGTVVLTYTVDDPTNLSTIKSAWVPVLLNATAY